SLIWALLIFFNLGFLLLQIPGFEELLPKQSAAGSETSFWHGIALSLGAGFYEEFFFRLLLVGLLSLLLPLFFPKMGKAMKNLLIILLTAVLFSLAHHIPPHGEPFTLYAFLFRTAFGIVMSGLIVFRGFGITAWTHALYDVLIDLRNLMAG
ncbi:MAG: type II CAAX prenyl endopeptidase Rce1 family protein, partial [Bacteroidota bacterium]